MIFSRAIAVVTLVIAVARPLYAAPVYDPDTKSYFEMVDGRDLKKNIYDEGPTWPEAFASASAHVYKGVHGRLAIIKSVSTHEFLERTFHPDSYVWIGMRYWCKARKLEWSDGEIFRSGSFQAWDKNWRQDVYACTENTWTDFMPVAYSPIKAGFRWIGKGSKKRYYYYFVEYPTGHP